MSDVLEVEKRSAMRSKTLKRGLVWLSSPARDCQVCIRNLSSTGAGIELDFAFALDKKFTLIFVEARTRVEVEAVWQSGSKAGVRFLGTPKPIHLR